MDKRPVYPGAIPLDLDWLSPQRNIEIALGFLMQATFGANTLVDGLATVPTTAPSMAVKVGPGSIITSTTVDTLVTGFGSLPVDNANPLVKMGVNLTSTTMGLLTAPVTAGFSVNVLVEAQFIEQDSGAVVLPFYNASNPSVPYTGPLNAGTSSNTARTQTVQLQYKYGTAAATGSQVTPSPDAGWIGVSVITIANGQSTVVAGNITPYVGAAGVTSIATKLPFVRQRLTAPLNLYISPTGSDSNSGLSASVPFFTMQKAWNTLVNGYDLNGQSVTINMANGTYTAGLLANGSIPGCGSGNAVTFKGNTSSPSSVLISTSNLYCISASNQSTLSVQGIKFTASGTDPNIGSPAGALVANAGSTIAITGPVEFGATAGDHLLVGAGASIVANGVSYTISGGGLAHAGSGGGGGTIGIANCTITVTGTPAFSTGFATAGAVGYVYFIVTTITGAATGPKFAASYNGVVSSNGGGVNFFPGSIAGTSSTGGQYA